MNNTWGHWKLRRKKMETDPWEIYTEVMGYKCIHNYD